MSVDGKLRGTIVVVHDHAGVLELIEQALRERGGRVLATRDPLEARELVRRLRIDLLVVAHVHSGLGPDLRTLQPDLPVLCLDPEPMSLIEVERAVLAQLADPARAGSGPATRPD
jgi:CheY-like chemotaxis protein